MSELKERLIRGILTPEVQEKVAAALAARGLPAFRAEDFTGIESWRSMFGSTTGPYGGIGGAAMTIFRFAVISSKDSMLLFADDERRLAGRLYGVARFDESVIEAQNWEAFTRS
jgi:hypothetical protein